MLIMMMIITMVIVIIIMIIPWPHPPLASKPSFGARMGRQPGINKHKTTTTITYITQKP